MGDLQIQIFLFVFFFFNLLFWGWKLINGVRIEGTDGWLEIMRQIIYYSSIVVFWLLLSDLYIEN